MNATVGLVAAGPQSKTFLSRMPGLAERLGPVLAPSRRLAGRLVASLRAGHTGGSYADLAGCGTVLIVVPEAAVRSAVADVAAADLDWDARVVLLCDSTRASAELASLASRGALIGSLSAVNSLEDLGFVVEGHRRAVREARRLVRNPARIQEVETARKAAYVAGITFGTALLTPLLDASVQCFRGAGFKPGAAAALADRLFQKTLRSYLHAGKKGRAVRHAASSRESVERQMAELRQFNPALARYFWQSAAAAGVIEVQQRQ